MDKRVQTEWLAPVRVESSLCSRFRSTKSRCTACAAVCPVAGAVHMSDAGAEVAAACVGCGACVSACPNGAMQARENDAQLAQHIRERVQPGTPFRIACTRAQGSAELVLPCLSRLTEALVLEPIRGGAPRVELLDPDCASCGMHRAARQWRAVASLAAALCETAGLGAARVVSRRVSSGKAQELQARASNPRRAMFRALAERWEASGGPAASIDAQGGATEPKPFREVVRHHCANRKRSDLLQLLPALPGAQPRPNEVSAEGVPLAQLEVDQTCVGCNVCETLCPVGALAHRDEGGRYILELDAALCTGCRVCEAVCYHHAIRLRESVDLAVLFEPRRVTLISAAKRNCRACGESVVGNASELCPTCRLSGDRREAVARSLFTGGNQSDRC